MGAGVATCVAGILRERVKRLILVEGLGPLSQPAEKVTELMRDSIQQWNSLKTKKSPVYQNREEAVRARHFAGKLKKSSVETLVARGLGENTDGLVWRSDEGSESSQGSILAKPNSADDSRHHCTSLVIEAEDTDTRRWVDLLRFRLRYVKNGSSDPSGGHHLHLDEPQSVASAIKDFLE